ncbi:Hypothetical predicted protein [Paramuricea clavata]|uniref:Uncharacterized protein n=1 Tax=Paramuricea clavata TaxID=317549 RepID=A0A7D9D8P5_PARCT|nr:Hypothetical predicted protein [Paramuricea clavata]
MGKEPKNLNSFLEPLVEESKALWKGVRLVSSLSTIPLVFKVALLCTSSDIPASRKLCGFKGHRAELGCSRCLKKFPGSFGEKWNYQDLMKKIGKSVRITSTDVRQAGYHNVRQRKMVRSCQETMASTTTANC